MIRVFLKSDHCISLLSLSLSLTSHHLVNGKSNSWEDISTDEKLTLVCTPMSAFDIILTSEHRFWVDKSCFSLRGSFFVSERLFEISPSSFISTTATDFLEQSTGWGFISTLSENFILLFGYATASSISPLSSSKQMFSLSSLSLFVSVRVYACDPPFSTDFLLLSILLLPSLNHYLLFSLFLLD